MLDSFSVLSRQNLIPCFLTFWSTEVYPHSPFKFLLHNTQLIICWYVCSPFCRLFILQKYVRMYVHQYRVKYISPAGVFGLTSLVSTLFDHRY